MEVVFGPPGTGKTTELGRLVSQYATDEGADSLLLCAYTKAAAQELAQRDLPIAPQHIGTLHAHCRRALGLELTEKHIDEWNAAYPLYAMTGRPHEDAPTHGTPLSGTALLALVDKWRHQEWPVAQWPPDVRHFYTRWGQWKAETGYVDFTDLLERACTMLPIAPGHPTTIIVDEAQDLSLLQWRLLRQWEQHAQRLIVAGDDDQALYTWAGADFHPLLHATTKRVLPHSYRVPASVQPYALQHITRVRDRYAKTWEPRAEAGHLEHLPWTWRQPHGLIEMLKNLLAIPWSGTLAVLAPCSYMLTPLLAALREEGIPFSNRWRRRRGDWNPLNATRGISLSQRLLDFLRPPERLWTWTELASWIPWIHAETHLHRGAKTRLAAHADSAQLVSLADLATILTPQAAQGCVTGGLNWLREAVSQGARKTLAYPVNIFRHYGRAGLTTEPRLTVGTIHSVKGAQADTVFLYTDLSTQQRTALRHGGREGDDVWRMLYVGITRARETLYVLGPQYV